VSAPGCYVCRMADTSPLRMNDLAGKARADVADLLDSSCRRWTARHRGAFAPDREAVLDVGCGAGQSVLQIADRVGPGGRVTASTSLRHCWSSHAAGPWGAATWTSWNAMRRGSHFRTQHRLCLFALRGDGFPGPVAAFSNFRRMMKPSGRLAFVCWRTLEENELDLLPSGRPGLKDGSTLDAIPFRDSGTIRTMASDSRFPPGRDPGA